MVRNTTYFQNTFPSSTTSSTAASLSDDITASESYEATQRITQAELAALAAVESINKPSESRQSAATATGASSTAPPANMAANRPTAPSPPSASSLRSRPIAVPTSTDALGSYDHADAQLLANDADYRHFLHRLETAPRRGVRPAAAAAGRAPQQPPPALSTSTIASEYLRYRVERGEAIVGSPNQRLPLLLPQVLAVCSLIQPKMGGEAESRTTETGPTTINTDAFSLGEGVQQQQQQHSNDFDNDLDDFEVVSMNEFKDAHQNEPQFDDADDGMIFDMEISDGDDDEGGIYSSHNNGVEDRLQYQSIFTSLGNFPHILNCTTVNTERGAGKGKGNEEEEKEASGDEVDAQRRSVTTTTHFGSGSHSSRQVLTTSSASSSSSSSSTAHLLSSQEQPPTDQRLAIIRQLAADLRQISADFAASRSQSVAATSQSLPPTPPTFVSFPRRCASLLVRLCRTLTAFALRQLNYWLLNLH